MDWAGQDVLRVPQVVAGGGGGGAGVQDSGVHTLPQVE